MSCVHCAVCREVASSSDNKEWCVAASCGHVFHTACLENCFQHDKGSCPICRVGAVESAHYNWKLGEGQCEWLCVVQKAIERYCPAPGEQAGYRKLYWDLVSPALVYSQPGTPCDVLDEQQLQEVQ